ncbi:hypothetical protein ANTRET_LOCUS9015 [Anthophora retusa]
MKNPFCIKISCPRIVDRPADPSWTQAPASSSSERDPSQTRSPGQLRTSGTSGSPIARDPDTRTAPIVVGFELTDLLSYRPAASDRSRVLSQPGVSCQCGNA